MNRLVSVFVVVLCLAGRWAGAAVVAPAPTPATAATLDEPARSPVETFRELLAMSPADRKATLGDRSPEEQRQIQAKIREYSAMRASEREVRLDATELYFYLWPLMKTATTNRAAEMARVPERQRVKVVARLRDWDLLPAMKQQELLTNALAVRHMIELQTQPPPLPVLSPAREARLERGVQQWQSLPPDQRRQITARFNQFFNLTEPEKAKALKTLSDPERAQIQKTLDKFARLTPAEREDYLREMEAFSRLSPAERQQFLKKAERWSALPSDERQEWREMAESFVRKPPLPPGAGPPFPGED